LRVKRISNDTDTKELLRKIDVSKEGIKIISSKMKHMSFFIEQIRTPAANILKQEALSIGAEFAVPKDTILCKDERVDGVLIINQKELNYLCQKLKAQPFGLKDLSLKLKDHLNTKSFQDIKIMGVLNINSDSFYAKSRFDKNEALKRVVDMVEDGANIIDIGALSSRPGSDKISEDEELERIRDIIDLIYKNRLYERVRFSLDSYSPKVISYALQRGFQIVNDITGLENDEVCKLISQYDASAVIMHKKGDPKTMQDNPSYVDVIDEIDQFFTHRIKKAEAFGIKDIILDVGIGFGKRLQDNLVLIKHLEHFKHFNKELLIGASRKSMIDDIMPTQVEDRLSATLALHLRAIQNGASIIRVHDVLEHKRVLSILRALDETTI